LQGHPQWDRNTPHAGGDGGDRQGAAGDAGAGRGSRRTARERGSDGTRGMSGKESLSLDEFATAPRRQRAAASLSPDRTGDESPDAPQSASAPAAREEAGRGAASSEASKALRQMKRARMTGA